MSTAKDPAPRLIEPDDGLLALVRWRLADPAWKPSFRDLLDDAQTCIGPLAGPPVVLAALRDVVQADAALAPRARIVAVEAHQAITARTERNDARGGQALGKTALRLLSGFRQAAASRS
ncbi:hypothetical protein [Phreatobacter stygius]|uniref:Uncharacterized protein n=1 Tax=Phreatobacter stygius TaxID=1940610 RepID=A0A4D7B6C3_9HYPH|nr:hypothetical protein [Phreatobacter stygius]QCI68551.1 hypothetical protein E8M01_32570 [Phreatobacter stygius]